MRPNEVEGYCIRCNRHHAFVYVVYEDTGDERLDGKWSQVPEHDREAVGPKEPSQYERVMEPTGRYVEANGLTAEIYRPDTSEKCPEGCPPGPFSLVHDGIVCPTCRRERRRATLCQDPYHKKKCPEPGCVDGWILAGEGNPCGNTGKAWHLDFGCLGCVRCPRCTTEVSGG